MYKCSKKRINLKNINLCIKIDHSLLILRGVYNETSLCTNVINHKISNLHNI